MITASQTECAAPDEWAAASNDALAVPGTPNGIGQRLADLFRAVIDQSAPVGYEDETGYHFGDMPEGSAEKTK